MPSNEMLDPEKAIGRDLTLVSLGLGTPFPSRYGGAISITSLETGKLEWTNDIQIRR